MATQKLTKKLIDSLVPSSKRYIVWDSEITGLGVQVFPTGARRPNGHKAFVLYYRTRDGVQRKPSLGPYGVLTVEKARDQAKDLLADVRHGEDPSAERKKSRAAPTVDEVADRYMTEHARLHKKPRSADSDELNLKLHVRPRWGSRKIASITYNDVVGMHSSMKQTPGAANRVLALLSKMFNLCEKWGLRPEHSNPCRHVVRYPEKRIHHDLSEIEVARLAKVLRESEEAFARVVEDRAREGDREIAEEPTAIAAIRLLLFTGCRRGEILNLKWAEVDLERRLLRLLDSKGGAKTIAMNAAAEDLLRTRPTLPGSPWVFPSPKDPKCPLVGLPKIWERIRKRTGLEKMRDGGAFRIHDLRHNLASLAASEGLSLIAIGKLLGHRNQATTARYAELVDAAQARAAAVVGGALVKAMQSTAEGSNS